MTAGVVRIPRGLVRINGEVMAGWESWSWDGNSMFQADQFSCAFAISGLPANRGVSWFAGQTTLQVELFAGFPADPLNFSAADLESLFLGEADEAEFRWTSGRLILHGRDLTARFLDNKTAEKWPEKTSSQIATILANRRGLTPVVTATSRKVGVYYKNGHVRLTDDRTEWDLLTWLAKEEGFVVYVKGTELHFEPPPSAGTYPVSYQAASRGRTPIGSQIRIDTTRVLTVARDITVTVRSADPKSKKTIVRKAQRTGRGGAAQNYVYSFPALSAAAAQQRANQILADLSRHEMRLRFSGPADNLLRKSDVISLTGTGTTFDQTYFPDSVTRTLDARGAYQMEALAKNHSPESDPRL